MSTIGAKSPHSNSAAPAMPPVTQDVRTIVEQNIKAAMTSFTASVNANNTRIVELLRSEINASEARFNEKITAIDTRLTVIEATSPAAAAASTSSSRSDVANAAEIANLRKSVADLKKDRSNMQVATVSEKRIGELVNTSVIKAAKVLKAMIAEEVNSEIDRLDDELENMHRIVTESTLDGDGIVNQFRNMVMSSGSGQRTITNGGNERHVISENVRMAFEEDDVM